MTYAACSIALIAAGIDLWSRRIPNQLVLVGLMIGLVIGAFTGGIDGLVNSSVGAITGFCLLLIPFIMGGMGGGDVKLMMALGSILGPVSIFWVFVYACLAGGVMSLTVMITSGRLRELAADWLLPMGIAIAYPRSPVKQHLTIPYGVAIAVGVIIFIARGVI